MCVCVYCSVLIGFTVYINHISYSHAHFFKYRKIVKNGCGYFFNLLQTSTVPVRMYQSRAGMNLFLRVTVRLNTLGVKATVYTILTIRIAYVSASGVLRSVTRQDSLTEKTSAPIVCMSERYGNGLELALCPR